MATHSNRFRRAWLATALGIVVSLSVGGAAAQAQTPRVGSPVGVATQPMPGYEMMPVQAVTMQPSPLPQGPVESAPPGSYSPMPPGYSQAPGYPQTMTGPAVGPMPGPTPGPNPGPTVWTEPGLIASPPPVGISGVPVSPGGHYQTSCQNFSGSTGGGCGSGACGSGSCGHGGNRGSCGSSCDSCLPTDCSCGSLALLLGFDGARGPDDLGINANVGGRTGFVAAFPLLQEMGIGFEVGAAVNYHRTATRFQRLNGGPGERIQQFGSLGIFQRADNGLVWGVMYDYLRSDSYNILDATQWRGLLGYRINRCNEVGIWGTHGDKGDIANFAGESYSIRPVNMFNVYYTHFWPSTAMTKVWVGVAEEHGRAILGIPGGVATNNPFVYGAEILAPLNAYFALFAEANIITPIDSGSVTAFVGIAFYPGGCAYGVPRDQFAPILPVANNPSFVLDARRR